MEYQNSNPSWSEQVEAEIASLAVPGNLEQGTITGIQASNNNLPVESQRVINEAPALNNTPSMHIEHKVIAPVEINMQSTHYEVPLSYNINRPTEPNAWDGKAHPISIFGTIEIDVKNIYTSLLCMANFIRSRKVKTGVINNIRNLKDLVMLLSILSRPFMKQTGTLFMLMIIIILLGIEL